MSYSLTTGGDYFQHLETMSTIRRTGQRIEATIHSGLMSLATAQADAMRDLGTRIDDRLVQVDETLLAQTEKLDLIEGTLQSMNRALALSFERVDRRLDRIEKTLDKIAHDTSNPEKARAFERFRRGLEFYRRGEYGRALDAVDRAIDNDGGPRFDEIVEFHLVTSPRTEDPGFQFS